MLWIEFLSISYENCSVMNVGKGYWYYINIDQSGTKPNLVTKILATNFGVFFVI